MPSGYEKSNRPANSGFPVRGVLREVSIDCGADGRMESVSPDLIEQPEALQLVLNRVLIADNLSKAGWSWGCVSAIDSNGRTIFVTDAHRDDGKRFVVHADEKLTAFMELEAAIPESSSFTRQCTVKRHSAGGQT